MAAKKNKTYSALALAAQVLEQVIAFRHSLSAQLDTNLVRLRDPRERAFTQYLCYGVMRHFSMLDILVDDLLRHPLKLKDGDIRCLLLVGLFQHIDSRKPDYAATSNTVAAARELNKSWACGLINAVLRNFLRQRDKLQARLDGIPAAQFAHPDWWLAQFEADWPTNWQAIAQAGNQQAPMTLRTNIPRDTYLEKLLAAGMNARPGSHSPTALILEKPTDVEALPGFTEGEVSVQDEAAQLAAPLLDVASGMRVLDACAAPGGKTAHILELQPDIECHAVDSDADRLQQVEDTLQRLNLSAAIHCGDAGNPADWWDNQPFDRILLDAPCSASGVIRRHPDIKHLRRPEDLETLANTQARLLDALWPSLAVGGKLVYATCSIFPQENSQQIQAFLARQVDAEEIPLDVEWGHTQPIGRQILPGEDDMDGFYYACLLKRDA